MRRVTIHDVAARAGVSLATVDRVLNGRSGVRPATVAKVAAAVEALSYRPDVHAASLAKKRRYRLKFLLPDGANAFMLDLRRETEDLALRLAGERIDLGVLPIDAFDSHSVAGTLAILDRASCDGVAVVAPASTEVRAAIDRLTLRGVPVVTLVSDHPGSARSHFVGIDNVAAGRVAGRLLGRFLPKVPAKVGFIAGSLGLRDHAERHGGCLELFEEAFSHLEPLRVREGRDDNIRTREIVLRLLDEHPDIAGLYSIGAGNRGVIAALEETGAAGRVTVVAHELTPHTRAALLAGTLDAVIAQDAGHEVRSAVRVLKALIDGKPLMEGQERIGIDIFLPDNLPPHGHGSPCVI
ncbi:LacI family DNA-binding transcriptional regulator [Polymorphum gilvum]|uniref:Putative transcription regulator protein n=1 Tax=Polymorphum gilvum (strain LMG 25793 / CGMCC 1.9160 / SL003B-26A1) TaxID=991905 RepID=F2J1T4_POLGS|nr:LacI family DNA-binding transcriptional regulator [Polymorphum gilvum]ADZ71995.1 Putative transcription regulator protein [Polymorphum gilvum SL003B-26A1]